MLHLPVTSHPLVSLPLLLAISTAEFLEPILRPPASESSGLFVKTEGPEPHTGLPNQKLHGMGCLRISAGSADLGT